MLKICPVVFNNDEGIIDMGQFFRIDHRCIIQTMIAAYITNNDVLFMLCRLGKGRGRYEQGNYERKNAQQAGDIFHSELIYKSYMLKGDQNVNSASMRYL